MNWPLIIIVSAILSVIIVTKIIVVLFDPQTDEERFDCCLAGVGWPIWVILLVIVVAIWLLVHAIKCVVFPGKIWR